MDDHLLAKKHSYGLLKKLALKHMMEGSGDETPEGGEMADAGAPDGTDPKAALLQHLLGGHGEMDSEDGEIGDDELQEKKKAFFQGGSKIKPRAAMSIMTSPGKPKPNNKWIKK